MNIKEIATEVVAALPADADFGDLDEFLFERAQVEQGREDFEAGRVRATSDVLGDVARDLSAVLWAESAATAFGEAQNAQDRDSLVVAVLEVARKLGRSEEAGISLPEMGDPSIRERHVRTPRSRYRIVYDTRGSKYLHEQHDMLPERESGVAMMMLAVRPHNLRLQRTALRAAAEPQSR